MALSFETFDARYLLAAFVLAAGAFAFYTYYHKSVLGTLVRALLGAGAESEETAKNFAELGLVPNALLLRALNEGSALCRVVSVVGQRPAAVRVYGRMMRDEEAFGRLRFFIAPEQEEKARGIYGDEISLFVPIFVTAASVVLAAALCAVLPQISALFA